MILKQKKSSKKKSKLKQTLTKHNRTQKQYTPLYEVEYIVDRRVNEKGQFEYLIKWQGYPSSQNTWEPKSNLEFTKELIKKYDLQFDLKKLEMKKDASTNTQEPFVKHDAVKILAHITKPSFQYYYQNSQGITRVCDHEVFTILHPNLVIQYANQFQEILWKNML
ncbi:Chromodomain Y-like protein 2 [Paramecium bursaria]